MRARPAHIQSLQWAAIVTVTQHRPRRKQLVQAQGAMKNVAADQAKGTFQIERAHDLPTEHGSPEVRRMTIDEIDHDVGDLVAMVVPGRAVRQDWSDMLAEQAGHMLSRRRQAVIQSRRYQHLYDGPLRPSAGFGIKIRLLHIGETRRHDDAGGVMLRVSPIWSRRI